MLKDEINNGETDVLEFKRDMPDDHLKFLKTAVAFANCNGGRIIFGVDDDRSLVGVDALGAFRLADRIVDAISNACAPQIAVSTEVATVEGKTLIVVSIPMGMSCPYYVKSLGKEDGTFVRVGATSRVADEDTVRELEFTGAGKAFDSQICRGMSVTPREIERLCGVMFRTARANCENADEKRGIRKATAAQLEDWGVLVHRGEEMLPTYAFALLAGSRKFWTEIQCAVFRGNTKANFIDRREFSGSVLKQIDAAYEYALSKINMGMELRGIYRRDVYEIPPGAIRELIVHAVVHRPYINPHAASIQVALYDTHLDIVSPGGLPHGMTVKMMEEGHSRARNKALALACRYMRIIEEWGSGIPRIQRMLSDAGLKPLEIINNGINLQFRIWRPTKDSTTEKTGGKNELTVEKTVEKTRERTTEKTTTEKNRGGTTEKATTEKNGGGTTEKTLGKTAMNILRIVQDFPSISMKDLASKCGITEDGVYWNIKHLKAVGRIRRVGPDKGGHWEVVE